MDFMTTRCGRLAVLPLLIVLIVLGGCAKPPPGAPGSGPAPPGQGGDELPGGPGRGREPLHDDQLRRGAAALHRAQRRLLGEEPSRPLPRQAPVGVSRRGGARRSSPLTLRSAPCP